jgi:peptidoglycan/LPS O-acetylase OafA/YrhL
VLSGFVLAHSYAYKEGLTFSTFMKSRFFRLYPLHLCMFFVIFALELTKLLAYKNHLYTFNIQPFTELHAIAEIVPNLLLLQSWIPSAKSISFNSPSWSISVEFYLYALFFGSIVAGRKHRAATWLASSIVAFMLIHFKSSLVTPEALRGISCFFGGAFIYHLFVHTPTRNLGYVTGTAVEALLLLMIIAVVQTTLPYRSLVASILFMATVFFFAFEFGALSRILKARPLQLLGRLSYSIYMTHFAILACMGFAALALQKLSGMELTRMIGDMRYLDFGSRTINNVAVLVTVGIFIAVSSVTYRYIEVPGQQLNKRRAAEATGNADKNNAEAQA